jgi:hypothetical protein
MAHRRAGRSEDEAGHGGDDPSCLASWDGSAADRPFWPGGARASRAEATGAGAPRRGCPALARSGRLMGVHRRPAWMRAATGGCLAPSAAEPCRSVGAGDEPASSSRPSGQGRVPLRCAAGGRLAGLALRPGREVRAIHASGDRPGAADRGRWTAVPAALARRAGASLLPPSDPHRPTAGRRSLAATRDRRATRIVATEGERPDCERRRTEGSSVRGHP